VLHICAAKGIRVADLTFEIGTKSADPSVVITPTCARGRGGAPAVDARPTVPATGAPPPGPGKAYAPPNRVNPKALGTGLSVTFDHTFTYGGDYNFANPVLMQGLRKGDLVYFEMHMGPINITDSGDAVVLTGFHYGGPTTITGPRGTGFVGELFRLTAGSYAQANIEGNNAYVAADWYHEGCAFTLVPVVDSAVVIASMTKVCTPYTSPMPELTSTDFDGLLFFESANAAYVISFSLSGEVVSL
jgi:hypothetical protein